MFEGVVNKHDKREVDRIKNEIVGEALSHLREFENSEHFIDKGGAGEVYGINQEFCIKITPDMHHSEHAEMLDLGNTVKQEANFLERLSMVRVKNINTRTPVYIGYAQREDGKDLIIMERLKATNLQWVLDGRATLPTAFNLEDFFADLESYLDYIQERMHISHGDIAPRNVMIDNDTGAPRLIDFGRSKFHLHDSPNDRATCYSKDWEDLQKVYDVLREKLTDTPKELAA